MSTKQIAYRRRTALKSFDLGPDAHNGPWFMAALSLLFAGLFAAPLAFGSVTPWGWGALCVVTALALGFWAIGAASHDEVKLQWNWLYLPFAAFLVVGAAQWATGRTLDPIATREALLKAATYLSILFLAGTLLASATERIWRRLGLAIVFYLLSVSTFAMIQFFAAPGKLYGVISPRLGGWVFGPYVNHNHYAGLMELLIPVACAFGYSQHQQVRVLTWFASGLALTSVLVSGSRAGAVSVAFAVCALVVIAACRARRQAQKAVVVAIATATLAVFSFAAFVVPPEVTARYEQTLKSPEPTLADRAAMSSDGWKMFLARPIAGFGLGSFQTAYPRFQSVASDLVVDHAHNDYVEALAETGAVGGGLIVIGLLLFAAQASRVLRGRSVETGALMRIGATVGCCALLIHSGVDFNLHIPANAAWMAACASLATGSTAQWRRDRSNGSSRPPEWTWS